MAAILRRTVFVDAKPNQSFRFADTALVLTELGAMWEDFPGIAVRQSLGSAYDDFDPNDEMARVDEVASWDGTSPLLYDQDTKLVDARTQPIVGK